MEVFWRPPLKIVVSKWLEESERSNLQGHRAPYFTSVPALDQVSSVSSYNKMFGKRGQ